MKLFWFFAAVAVAQEVDDLGNKKNKDADKGPRECNGIKLADSGDGKKFWKCRSRNPSNKNPHLTKRGKLKCKKGTQRDGHAKVYCSSGEGWVLRKSPDVITPGDCV